MARLIDLLETPGNYGEELEDCQNGENVLAGNAALCPCADRRIPLGDDVFLHPLCFIVFPQGAKLAITFRLAGPIAASDGADGLHGKIEYAPILGPTGAGPVLISASYDFERR